MGLQVRKTHLDALSLVAVVHAAGDSRGRAVHNGAGGSFGKLHRANAD
jgi:hypothetical protein